MMCCRTLTSVERNKLESLWRMAVCDESLVELNPIRALREVIKGLLGSDLNAFVFDVAQSRGPYSSVLQQQEGLEALMESGW